MTTPCEKLLAEIEARLKAATPGPWEDCFGYEENCSGMGKFLGVKPTFSYYFEKKTEAEVDSDIKFIAHSRTDLEKLAAMVKAARYRLGEYAAGRCIVSAWAEETLRELDRIAKEGAS